MTEFLRASVSRAAELRRSERTRFSVRTRRRSRPGSSMFAPPICRRRWRDNAFPFRQIRRRRRQPSEHRSEQSEQSTELMREQKDQRHGLE